MLVLDSIQACGIQGTLGIGYVDFGDQIRILALAILVAALDRHASLDGLNLQDGLSRGPTASRRTALVQ
jgi:hypothetical protein